MATPKTTFILTDIEGDEVYGDIHGAQGATVSLPHMRIANASLNLPIWHPRAQQAQDNDCLLWATRTDHVGARRPILCGPVIATEETAGVDGETVQIVAANPFWRLNKRLLGKTKAGLALGTPSVPLDLGEMQQQIVELCNGEGFTGVVRGDTTATNSAYLQQVWLKPAAQQIAELAASINGPEFEIAPVVHGTFQGGWPVLGELNAAPLIGGITREDAIFEYGTARGNVANYRRARTLDGVMTRGWISTPGWPDGTTDDLITHDMTAAIAARGVYEDIVNDAGIIDPGLRLSLLNAHLDVRQSWRQTITFTPAMNARPGFQADYNVGDFVRCRAVIRGKVRFDAYFRVWGVTLTYDANGNESVELELLPQEAGA